MLEVKDLHCSYGTTQVLKGVDLNVNKGEVISILGSSGSGKTTLLRCISFLQKADSGTIRFDDFEKDITQLKHSEIRALRMKMGYVFQNFNLFRNMTVKQNVLEGLITARGVDRATADKTADEVLEKVGMLHRKDFYPDQLSGGQQQRVAIARALVNHPKVLLLDEPLGALDLKLRKDMQIELKRIQQSLDITFIYVTHDQEEALTMSDTVVVMNRGDIQQIGSPQDIYNEPNNAFVADFIGESNILDGVMLRDFRVEFAGQEFTCVDAGFGSREIVQVVVRPEDIQVVPAIQGQLTGLVENVIFKGVHYEMHVRQAGYEWIIHSTQASQVGELIGMNIGPDEIHIMHRTQG